MMTARNVPLRGIADSTKRESAPPAIKELNEEDPSFKMSFEFEPDPEDSEDDPEKNR
jgi:hypothetical protein